MFAFLKTLVLVAGSAAAVMFGAAMGVWLTPDLQGPSGPGHLEILKSAQDLQSVAAPETTGLSAMAGAAQAAPCVSGSPPGALDPTGSLDPAARATPIRGSWTEVNPALAN